MLSCITDSSFDFSKRDSAFWFDNFSNIYNGKLKAHDMCSFNPIASKCYLDLSSFDNVNLRNFILLYDVVYFAPPLEDKIFEFLKKQNISMDDIIELARRGRLVLFLTNSESRYNKDLVMGVYKANPNAIFSKRAINALLASYFTQLADNYIFNSLDDYRLLMDIRKNSVIRNKKLENFISIWTWPVKAKIESFRLLNFSSPLVLSSIGINNIALEYYKEFNNDVPNSNAYEFEFAVNYSNVQIATALEATYFPFFSENKTYSDAGIANILGSFLNIYKHSADAPLKTLNMIGNSDLSRQNAIKLLCAKELLSILKFDEFSYKYNTKSKLSNLLLRLESLDLNERNKIITEYNELVLNITNQGTKKSEDWAGYFLSLAGFIPYIGSVPAITGFLKSIYADFAISDQKRFSKLIDKASDKFYSKDAKDEIYLFDKVDRVAKIMSVNQ